MPSFPIVKRLKNAAKNSFFYVFLHATFFYSVEVKKERKTTACPPTQ